MRLNRGAVKLTEQELRNCLYRGRFNDLLHQLREEELVQKMLGLDEPDNRMADAEVVLRHFTIRGGYDPKTGKIATYSGNMKSSLNHYMEKMRNVSVEDAELWKRQFLSDAEKVDSVFGENAYRRINADGTFDDRPNRAIMDAVLTAMAPHDGDAIRAKKDQIVGLLGGLINDDERFADAITTRTSDKMRMEYRVHTFYKKLSEIMGEQGNA